MTNIINALPKDFILRAPTMDDLEAVTQLIVTCDIADSGEPDYTTDDLLIEWQRKGFDLTSDAWIITTPQGQVIGYTDVWEDGLGMLINPNTCVHPDYRHLNLERYLFQLAEERAREYLSVHESVRRVSRTISLREERHQLLEQEGYKPVRYTWRMEIDMNDAPPAPVWPEGFSLRTFVRGQDERAVHSTIQEAFSDLEGHVYHPFEEWERAALKRNDFDPSLLFIVIHGNEMAAAALCYEEPWKGWVRQLAVRRPWRKRGLGMQLLHQAFGEFYRRGKRKVGLTVDAKNTTGATRLYERVGMHIALQMTTYEKNMEM
jgi:GNAT superfamily N-acetyltransferase